jgi:hypothetical protein
MRQGLERRLNQQPVKHFESICIASNLDGFRYDPRLTS